MQHHFSQERLAGGELETIFPEIFAFGTPRHLVRVGTVLVQVYSYMY